MRFLTLTFAICLVAMVTAGSTGSLSTAQKCKYLEAGLDAYLPNRMLPDMLFGITGSFVDVDMTLLRSLVKSSRIDFLSSRSGRHQFACKLAAARSRQDIAKLMGVPKSRVDAWYKIWQAPIQEVGSIKKMDDVTKVATLLFIWAENSHYPVMPFRINDAMTLKTFGAIKNVMQSKHVHDALINSPFPLKVSPTRALQKLKTAKSYTALEKGLMMDRGTLSDFAEEVKENPRYLQQGKANLKGTMQLMKVLDITGILYFRK